MGVGDRKNNKRKYTSPAGHNLKMIGHLFKPFEYFLFVLTNLFIEDDKGATISCSVEILMVPLWCNDNEGTCGRGIDLVLILGSTCCKSLLSWGPNTERIDTRNSGISHYI